MKHGGFRDRRVAARSAGGFCKSLVAVRCGQCPSLELVLEARRTRRQPETQIELMVVCATIVTGEEINVIAAYFADYGSAKTPP